MVYITQSKWLSDQLKLKGSLLVQQLDEWEKVVTIYKIELNFVRIQAVHPLRVVIR